jgi:AcrR family transcriptional regulator
MSEVEVPSAIALAWGVHERPSPGPKRTLSLEQIVIAGTSIARSEGLAAVSMARVATEIGVSTMALYRYVASKDDLLELMVDSGLGQPPRLPPNTPWRSGLRAWAEGCRDAYRGDPWALKVPITGPPLGPNNVRWLEFGLSVLSETLLSAQQKLSTVLTLSAFVRGEETLRTDILAHVTKTGQMPPDYGQVLTLLIDPAHFPEVHKAITAGSLSDDDPGDIGMNAEFEFGLERILDGVEALVRATRRARPKSARRD